MRAKSGRHVHLQCLKIKQNSKNQNGALHSFQMHTSVKKLSEAVVFVETILNRDPVRGGSGGQLNPLEF